MKWWEIILCFFCIYFCYYSYTKTYENIFKTRSAFNFKKNLFLFVIILITYYNTFYNYNFLKIVISFFELVVVFKIVFNEYLKDIILKTIILYFMGWVIETSLGGLIFYLFFNSVQQFDNNITMKVLFSFLMMLIILLLSYVPRVKKIVKKINKYMCKNINLTLMITLFIVVLVILTFYLIVTNEVISYISIIALIIIFTFLFIMVIIQNINSRKENEKQEALLKFMQEYETIIDKERMDRHEIINNLLVLKSIKNKNTKEYDMVLDDLLKTYKNEKTCQNLYDLPSGLKGIFYYKMYDMKIKNIKTFINISNSIITELDKLNSKNIANLSKILGILLDNAKEAAEESKEKQVIIDLYREKNISVIYIENSFKNDKNLDINNIRLKGFSTKGENRGFGLYLTNKILLTNKKINLLQKIEQNKFISILQIKNL